MPTVATVDGGTAEVTEEALRELVEGIIEEEAARGEVLRELAEEVAADRRARLIRMQRAFCLDGRRMCSARRETERDSERCEQ